MFYTVYKITNLVNNKIYVGSHITKDLNDNYMGSGKILLKAIKKYGLENFKKEILYKLNSKEEMFLKEKEIVNEDFLKRIDTYNLKEGGEGGWDYVNTFGNPKRFFTIIETIKGIESQKSLCKYDKEWLKNRNDKISKSIKIHFELGGVGSFRNKNHTTETKIKISKSNSKNQLGERNSQFGTMWIYNVELKENKKIKKDEIIPDGWLKGRKMLV